MIKLKDIVKESKQRQVPLPNSEWGKEKVITRGMDIVFDKDLVKYLRDYESSKKR